jgi:hypothetical protein
VSGRGRLAAVAAAAALAVVFGGHEALAVAEWRHARAASGGVTIPHGLLTDDRRLWLENLVLVTVAVAAAIALPAVAWWRRGRGAAVRLAWAVTGVGLILWVVTVVGSSERPDESCLLGRLTENTPTYVDRGWSWREQGHVVILLGARSQRVVC